VLDEISESENVELLVEKGGALRTYAFEEFYLRVKKGCQCK
jgi:hypothetical protein